MALLPAQEKFVNYCGAVFQTLAEIGDWTPRGPLYAILMGFGCSKATFDEVEATLVRARVAQIKGDQIRMTPKEGLKR